MNNLLAIRKLYDDWLSSASFPEESNDDELSDIHADLALYDGNVGGHVSYLCHGEIPPQGIEDLFNIEQRLNNILADEFIKQHKDSERYKDAMRYYTYFKRVQWFGMLAQKMARK